MSRKLELVREEKLFRLLPGTKKKSRLEASGVALVDGRTALVVFDNINEVAIIDISLKRKSGNRLFPVRSLGSGFEDIAIDHRHRRFFCLIEALEDSDGAIHGFVVEYDRTGNLLRSSRLETRFQKTNKGFEGLAHIWRGGREYLYALCEGNLGTDKRRGGRIVEFLRARDRGWKTLRRICLPDEVEFEDYAALDYRDRQLAIVSQESKRLWVGRIDESARVVVPGSSLQYRFPRKSYGNVEGIAWLSPNTLVAVSDRRKKHQPSSCAEKDQSIHVFRIPAAKAMKLRHRKQR